MNLVDLLDESARGRGEIAFLSPGGAVERHQIGELWASAKVAAHWLVNTVGAGGRIGAVLTASPACIVTVFAAWRSGLTLISLPTPARGVSAEDYTASIESMCAQLELAHMMIDADYIPFVVADKISIHAFDDVLSGSPPCAPDEPGDLIQFSSGSTGRPKGIRLKLDGIAHNILAIIETLEMRSGEVVCSWLPLSHDMGFIGMLLCSVVSAGPQLAKDTKLMLLRPEHFLADPAIWLRACSDHHATITGTPNFGLDIAVRARQRAGTLDLSNLRVLLIGSEKVRAPTLRNFQESFRAFALAPAALSPAYGLAEATLAVAINRPRDTWRSATIDPDRLAKLHWEPTTSHGIEIVSNGPALPGVSCKVRAGLRPGSVGELTVSGPSLLSAFVGEPRAFVGEPRSERIDVLRTGDLGYVDGAGDVFVIGRGDDVIVTHGRKLFGPDLADAAEALVGIRKGNCVAVAAEAGGYAIVAEPRAADSYSELAGKIRANLVRQFGVAPSGVVFIEPGSMPKTPSGKIQAFRVRALLDAGRLPVNKRIDFGGRER